MDGTVTAIAAYPAGETDLDALAIDNNGRAYLVPDQPGSIYVYDLIGGSYLAPFANPWTTAEIFSGAAYILPAAASASVSGGVRSPSGSAIRNALVRITDGGSLDLLVWSNSFGYFSFTGIPTGPTYSLSAQAKGYTFTPVDVPVSSDVSGLTLTADNDN
jgi:hypothetical protein